MSDCYLCGPRGSVEIIKLLLGVVERRPHICDRCRVEHLEPPK